MDAWKKALLMASLSAAAVLFLKKRYPAGVLATGVSLAMLASEYPQQFERVRQSLPDFFERGMRVIEMAGQAGKRITEAAGRGGAGAWEEIG
jgi:hypothetical protein